MCQAIRNAPVARRGSSKGLAVVVFLTMCIAAGMVALAMQRSQNTKLAQQWIQKADEAFASRRLKFAKECYQRSDDLHRGSGAAMLGLAEIARFEGTADDFTACIKQARFAGASESLIDRAETKFHVQSGQSRLAMNRVDRVLTESSEDKGGLLEAYALGFAAKRDHRSAMKVTDKWLSIEPESAIASMRRGQSCLELGMLRDAEASFELAIKHNPELIDAHMGLARAAFSREQDDKAIKHFRIVAEVQPNNTSARIALASLLLTTRKFDEAVAEFEWVIKKQPSNFAARYSLANYLVNHGEPQRAIDLMQSMAKKVPDDVQFNYLLANAYHQLGQHTESRACLEKHLEGHKALDQLQSAIDEADANPGDQEIRRKLAFDFLKYEWNSSQRWLAESLSARPNDAEIHEGMALFWQLNGNADVATKFRKSAQMIRQSAPGSR